MSQKYSSIGAITHLLSISKMLKEISNTQSNDQNSKTWQERTYICRYIKIQLDVTGARCPGEGWAGYHSRGIVHTGPFLLPILLPGFQTGLMGLSGHTQIQDHLASPHPKNPFGYCFIPIPCRLKQM